MGGCLAERENFFGDVLLGLFFEVCGRKGIVGVLKISVLLLRLFGFWFNTMHLSGV